LGTVLAENQMVRRFSLWLEDTYAYTGPKKGAASCRFSINEEIWRLWRPWWGAVWR